MVHDTRSVLSECVAESQSQRGVRGRWHKPARQIFSSWLAEARERSQMKCLKVQRCAPFEKKVGIKRSRCARAAGCAALDGSGRFAIRAAPRGCCSASASAARHPSPSVPQARHGTRVAGAHGAATALRPWPQSPPPPPPRLRRRRREPRAGSRHPASRRRTASPIPAATARASSSPRR